MKILACGWNPFPKLSAFHFMTGIVTLLILALILATFEIVIPGGILAGLAFLAILAASMLAYQEYGLLESILTFSVSLIVILVVVVLELKLIQKTGLRERFILSHTVEGRTLKKAEAQSEWLGKTGEAITPLTPTGMIRIDHRQIEAASKSGRIERGETVEVIGEDNFRVLVVRKRD